MWLGSRVGLIVPEVAIRKHRPILRAISLPDGANGACCAFLVGLGRDGV